MHGRLKVKTTEEQQKAKQEERAKKLKLYNAATSRAFQKRKAGELDSELLEITGQVLQASPDFYTFWNMRKETFLRLHDTMETEEVQKLYCGELDFLQMCLKINPKSYGAWHHRCFVMDHMPKPDWKQELELCNLFLQYDERNFHCWDYRRFVVKRSKVPPSEEFDFTTSKISSNFSNFSSWHYRSNLLTVLHPGPSQPSGIAQDIFQSGELQGADLDLLGQGDGDIQVEVKVTEGGEEVCQHLLILPSSDKDEISFVWSASDMAAWFREELCGVDEETLHRELQTIQELQEVESTNKWAMLTLVLLMKASDPVSYHHQILSLLQQLQTLDSPRGRYYRDLRSRFIIESVIATLKDQKSLSLQGQKLTTMCCTELLPLVRELDLSDNALTQVRDFSYLKHLQRLNLATNQLSSCQGLSHLPRLTHLDLTDNSIPTVSCLLPLQTCPQLKSVTLSGNPLCEDPCVSDQVREILPSVEIQFCRESQPT